MNRTIVRTIGVIGALFNAVGVQNYLAHVGALGGGPAPADTAPMPVVVTAAFATAVFAGLIGSIGLALLQSWARPVLWLTFVASVVNWGWVLTNSDQASVPLGVTVIVVSLLMALVGERMHRASGTTSRLAAT